MHASAMRDLTVRPRNQKDTARPGNDAATTEGHWRPTATVLLKGTTVHGNIISTDNVMVDGTLHGEVRGLHVWIGRDASVEGAVVAERVTVEGTIRGPVFAEHIHLGAASRVSGDLCSDNISMDKGAMLSGRVWPSQPSSHLYPRRERLSQGYQAPTASPAPVAKVLEVVATEKSPSVGPDEQKDP